MNKIGLYFSDLINSQAIYEGISSANNMLDIRKFDFYLFYNNIGLPPVEPLFGTFHIDAAHNFNGTIIATTVQDAILISKLASPKRKIFYAYDLEWYGHKALPYQLCLNAYRNNKLELWARSNSHVKALETCFNRAPNGIMKNFEMRSLYEGQSI